MIIFHLFFIILLTVFIVFGLFYLWEGRGYKNSSKRVVYMGSNLREQGKILKKLIQKYIIQKGEETDNYYLIEPGAGIATVATYLGREFKWKGIEAIELRKSVAWAGMVRQLFFHLSSKFTYKVVDIFEYQPPKPSLIYCYLTGTILTGLYKEGRLDGCLVICLTFTIEGCKPVETIQLKSWQKALYVYDFRKTKAPQSSKIR